MLCHCPAPCGVVGTRRNHPHTIRHGPPSRAAAPQVRRFPSLRASDGGGGKHSFLRLEDVLQHNEQNDLSRLTVVQLKELLRQRGLKVSGNKGELIERLQMEAGESPPGAASSARKEGTSGSGGGDPGEEDVLSVDSVAAVMLRAGVSVPKSYVPAAGSTRLKVAADDAPPGSQERGPGQSRADVAPRGVLGGARQDGTPPRQQRQRPARQQAEAEAEGGAAPVAPRGGSDKLHVPGLVIVEGSNDVKALQSAVSAERVVAVKQVENRVKKKQFSRTMKELAAGHKKVFLLLDPDNTGAQYRALLNQLFPGALNIFVPVSLCSAVEGTKWHEAGSVGVENASPAAIRAAFKRARAGQEGREEFTMDELVAWGLVGRMGDTQEESQRWLALGGIATRRRLFAEALGLHDAAGATVLKYLNRYFRRDEVMAALDGLPKEGDPIPEKMTDRDDDPRRGAPPPSQAFPSYPMA
eukprot:jgi/Tetstr1/457833/TSEL_044378.t1